MNRLTTSEEYPHGAGGKTADKLTGHWCRGKFEAPACVEKLSRYEDTGLEPEEIIAIKRLAIEALEHAIKENELELKGGENIDADTISRSNKKLKELISRLSRI